MRLAATLLALPALAAAQEHLVVESIIEPSELQPSLEVLFIEEIPAPRQEGCLHNQLASLSSAMDEMVMSLFAQPIIYMEEARPSAPNPCEPEMRVTGCQDAFCLKQHPEVLGDACVLTLLSDVFASEQASFSVEMVGGPMVALQPVELEHTSVEPAETRDAPMLLGANGHGQRGFVREETEEEVFSAMLEDMMHAHEQVHMHMHDDAPRPYMHAHVDGHAPHGHMRAQVHGHDIHGMHGGHHGMHHEHMHQAAQAHAGPVLVSADDDVEPMWTSAATPTASRVPHHSFGGLLLMFAGVCCIVRACAASSPKLHPAEPPTVVILEPLQSGAVPPVQAPAETSGLKPVSDIKML